MSIHASLTSVLDRALTQGAPDSSHPPLVWRSALGLAVAMTAAATATIAAPFSAAALMDPDLVRLLRAMVVIKGIIALAATGLVFWRLGHGIRTLVAIGYGTAVCVSVAALVWLWGLASIPVGSLLFYGGLVALILVGRFDSGLWVTRVR
jgi:hypothetical protein